MQDDGRCQFRLVNRDSLAIELGAAWPMEKGVTSNPMAPEGQTGGDMEGALGPKGPRQERLLKVLVWAVGILATLGVLCALYLAMWIAMPVVASFFIAIAVWPVTDWMQRRLPARLSWLGYVAAMAVIVLILGAFGLGLWFAASVVEEEWSHYSARVEGWWNDIANWLTYLSGSAAGTASPEASAATSASNEEDLQGVAQNGVVGKFALRAVQSIGDILGMMILIFFLVLLMLTEARAWQMKVASATNGTHNNVWAQIVADVAQGFRSYVLIRGLLGLITGALYGFWLWLWGVDLIVVWVLLAFLLNFVPTLGSLIAGGAAAAFAFLQHDLGTAVAIGFGLFAIEQVMGNYVDPRLQGRRLSISPLVVLVMLLLWTWIWGVAGALLAVPITVLLVMVLRRAPGLAPIAHLFSHEVTGRQHLGTPPNPG